MHWIRYVTAILAVFILYTQPAAASAPYKSYIYTMTSSGIRDVEGPIPYIPVDIYDALSTGVAFNTPEDMYRDEEGNFYIADSGTDCIYSFDARWNLRYSLSEFNGGMVFNNPTGVYAAADGFLYVADTDNGRIVVFKKDGTFSSIIPAPVSPLFNEGFVYRPLKIAVDNSGRILVVAKDVFEGIMQLTGEGEFLGYVGSNRVSVNPFELMWRRILTDQQISKMKSFIPVEYRNLHLDPYGFIYAVTAVSDVSNPIRRLNPSGADVLARRPINGTGMVTGDMIYYYSAGPSTFVDITIDDRGIYYALDNKRGRVFAYDEDGNMLFVFGSLGSGQKGAFFKPVAIVCDGDDLLVLDKESANITRFVPTNYTKLIFAANESYIEGDYEKALVQWEGLLKNNANFDLAYVRAGFSLYRLGRYEDAMKYFKHANTREYYSKAYEKYRKQKATDKFSLWANLVFMVYILLMATLFFVKRNKGIFKKRLLNTGNLHIIKESKEV